MQQPQFIQIEPVGQCNLRCLMCPIQFRLDGPPHGPLAFMDFALFKQIIDQAQGVAELHLQGLGEPLMHPRFFEMVAYAANRGMRVSANSNLTILNARRAAECVASGLDTIHVSIDGATAETYETIRVRARLPHVLKNLRLLMDAREQANSELPHLRLVVVVMQRNLHELAELVRFAHEWKFKSIFVQHLCHEFGESSLPDAYHPMRDFVQAETLLNAEPQRIELLFREARRVADALGIELRLPNVQPHLHAPGTPGIERCDWPWRGAYFSYQGLAMPCCMVATPDRINFGSVTEREFSEIWEGNKYQAFRAQLSSDSPPEVCRSCSVYKGVF